MAEIVVGALLESLFSCLISLAKNELRKVDFKEKFEQMKKLDLSTVNKGLREKVIIGDGTDDDDEDKVITLKELIRSTGNFCNENKIGSGSLGNVYVARLGNRKLAVKRLLSSLFKKRSWNINEIYNLRCLKHMNLIKCLDFHDGKGVQLLVYEYMEHKSLEDALFGSEELKRPWDPLTKYLSWKTRFEICLGIARGLEFLHKHLRLGIIHGNIKASNILLNGNFQPKLSNFGLASVYADEDQLSFIKREAPRGYVAPEYFQDWKRTTKTDIYSFGVVLLEIVCGKKNGLIEQEHGSKFLLEVAHSCSQSHDLLLLVDPSLCDHYKDQEALNILSLAVMCTNISPSCRPTISDVLSVLTGKKTIEDIRQSKHGCLKIYEEDKSVLDLTEVNCLIKC